MGRLLKKKPAVQKKKVPQATDAEVTQDASIIDNSASSLTIVPGKEAKRKTVGASRKISAPVRTVAGPVKRNILDKSLQFLREVKVELKKVTWPSRKQTVGSTLVVIVLVLIISFFLGVIDIGLSKLVQLVLQ
ncbi:MAG: preprotein translocase subunit SecE [Pseudomonadota bacterium]